MHESHDVVPKRHANKWAEHATQPYDESESTTLGSMNNTLGNASLKSDSSTLWFKKDKPNKDALPSTQAYDEESTQGPERAEITVIVTAPTQAYEEPAEDAGPKDAAATQAYDEPSSEVKHKDISATLAYDEESDVPMRDVNATLAYEEPSSPVKAADNNATQAYEEPASPVKAADNNATQAYEEPASPMKTVDNNATQAYEEPASPPKLIEVNATLAYEEDKSAEDNNNNATQAYEEPSSPKLPDNNNNNATQAYEEQSSPKLTDNNNNNNATQAYEEPVQPADTHNNATQAYEEPASPVKAVDHNATQAYDEPEHNPPVTPSKTTKVVTFAEVSVTQVYEESASPMREDMDTNNATLPIIEQHSPPEIDHNATLPIAEHDSPESNEPHTDKMEIDRPETTHKREDEEPSSLFHDSHPRDRHSQPVNPETRHSDSSDTQGPAQSKVTVSASSKITTSIVESTLDNEATLMIVDSTEIKNNESLEATLRLPSTPPLHASADSLSDEAVESMPSDLWFIKHKGMNAIPIRALAQLCCQIKHQRRQQTNHPPQSTRTLVLNKLLHRTATNKTSCQHRNTTPISTLRAKQPCRRKSRTTTIPTLQQNHHPNPELKAAPLCASHYLRHVHELKLNPKKACKRIQRPIRTSTHLH